MKKFKLLLIFVFILNFSSQALISKDSSGDIGKEAEKWTKSLQSLSEPTTTQYIDEGLQEKIAYYLTLEKNADVSYAKSLQAGWGEGMITYKKECFFRDVASTYEKASALAIEINMLTDAIRLKEKQAMIWVKKLDSIPVAINLLLEAYKFSDGISDSIKIKELSEKINHLADIDVEDQYFQRDRPVMANFRWHCNYNIAQSLQTKAEVLERTDPLLAENQYQKVKTFCKENDVSYEYVMKIRQQDQDEDETSEIDFDFECIDHINALIDAADILEDNNQKELAVPCYKEAGKLCMCLDDRGIALGHLHPALIAALCFEKDPHAVEQKNDAYEKILKDYCECDSLDEEMTLDDEEFNAILRFVFSAPSSLEVSCASLRYGKQDLYAEIICDQITSLLSIYKSCPDLIELEESDSDAFPIVSCIEAYLNVSEIVLGRDNSHFTKLKECQDEFHQLLTKIEHSEASSYIQLELETGLLDVYAAPKDISVREMIKRLEGERLIRP